jgi:hypothetical protein
VALIEIHLSFAAVHQSARVGAYRWYCNHKRLVVGGAGVGRKIVKS